MNATTRKRLILQGYSEVDICDCKNIDLLARWTPSACALFGAVGLILRSPLYFWILGACTLLGAFGPQSAYDYLYILFIRPVLHTGEMPNHGNQRRFGCAIGAFLFVLSGFGFHAANPWLAWLPSATIVFLALIAATTQWCFASTLYVLIWGSTSEE